MKKQILRNYSTMRNLLRYPEPGDVIVVDCGAFDHFALASDTYCASGKPMLIGASQRTGTVKEEAWGTVVGNNRYKIVKAANRQSAEDTLQRAKSRINSWSYNLAFRNCEHFVNWARHLEPESKQVLAAGTAGTIAGVATQLMCESPKLWKTALGIGVGALIGVQLAKRT
ncbi:lecithin retinol acyltransferase family protein [Thalassolituus sp.]|uniref:lecithin retinol acyltransferase family protein n=1 Tax=Thalassolituus sp. TaxID=2030822 RepID=UPI0035143911